MFGFRLAAVRRLHLLYITRRATFPDLVPSDLTVKGTITTKTYSTVSPSCLLVSSLLWPSVLNFCIVVDVSTKDASLSSRNQRHFVRWGSSNKSAPSLSLPVYPWVLKIVQHLYRWCMQTRATFPTFPCSELVTHMLLHRVEKRGV